MYSFSVETMTCGGCAAAITRAIHKTAPNAKVNAFPTIRRVDIESDLTVEELLPIFEAADYPAQLIEGN